MLVPFPDSGVRNKLSYVKPTLAVKIIPLSAWNLPFDFPQ